MSLWMTTVVCENAQVKQPIQQYQGTAKRKMLGLDKWLLSPRIEACCHNTHM